MALKDRIKTAEQYQRGKWQLNPPTKNASVSSTRDDRRTANLIKDIYTLAEEIISKIDVYESERSK